MIKIFHVLKFLFRHPIASKNILKSIRRFISWQIASLLFPKSLVTYDFVNGTSLFMRRGLTGSTGNYYAGLHEYREMKFFLKALREEDLFIDIGANIGSYSILAASICDEVFSFEPIANTFAVLNQNIKLNCFESKIKAYNVGLSDKRGKLFFTTNLDTVNHVTLNAEKNTAELEVDCLDNIIRTTGKNVLIKIDVEGFELNVLQGAVNFLNDNNVIAIIVETNNSSSKYFLSGHEIFEFLMKNGFRPVHYDYEKNLIEPYERNDNSIFVRSIDKIQERLSKSSIVV